MEDEALYSLSQIRDMAQGDESFVQEMIGVFIENTRITFNELKAAYSQGDLKITGERAHKLKPSFRIFDQHKAADLAFFIEQAGKKGENSQELQQSILELEAIIQMMLPAMEKEIV